MTKGGWNDPPPIEPFRHETMPNMPAPITRPMMGGSAPIEPNLVLPPDAPGHASGIHQYTVSIDFDFVEFVLGNTTAQYS